MLNDEPLTDSQQKVARTILDCSHGLLNLINNFLDFSKIKAGKLDIEWLHCDLSDILNEIFVLFQSAVREKGLILDIDVDPAAPRRIITDPVRLHQCLFNLVSNALKFTESGSIHIHVRLQSPVPDSALCIEISDTGIGIDPGRIDCIFDPHIQTEGSAPGRFSGIGMGLAITHKLIHLLGGQIRVSSNPGKGSIFSMVLPMRPQTLSSSQVDSYPQTELSASLESDRTKSILPLARILVVEDDSANQLMMSTILHRLGYEVECVEGDRALQMARTHLFDLVLTDRSLGDRDGLDIARQLRRDKIEIPIVLVTADTHPTLQTESIAAGCTACLLKPVTQFQIRDTLDTLLPARTQTEGDDPHIPSLIRQLSGLLDSGCRYRALRLIQLLTSACRAADFL